jgi:hypothetical protein
MTTQEISDRLELKQLSVDYGHAIDRLDFDRLDRVFTPDAHIDYSCFGGAKGAYPEVKAYLIERMPHFGRAQHLALNNDYKIDGDEATGVIACFNPMEMKTETGDHHVMFFMLWYHDRYVRTPQGWRIASRREERWLEHNVPAGLIPPRED